MDSNQIEQALVKFKSFYDLALERYRKGARSVEKLFSADETEQLAALGCRPIEIFDCVDDFSRGGAPDWKTVRAVMAVRLDYFFNEQHGKWTGHRIGEKDLPPKPQEVDGIPWLPRLIVKARAKLRGELPDEFMYGCGGDRSFFSKHNVDQALFLRETWNAGEDDAPLIAYVKKRAGI